MLTQLPGRRSRPDVTGGIHATSRHAGAWHRPGAPGIYSIDSVVRCLVGATLHADWCFIFSYIQE